MTFHKLSNENECDCLQKAVPPKPNEVFLRKLRKDILAEKDFDTHWERGVRGLDESCDEICKFKALSINKAAEETEVLIYEHYKTTFSINPKKGAHCLKFKFKEDAGVVIHSPNINSDSHHDFFKSDIFTIAYIEPIEVIKFA